MVFKVGQTSVRAKCLTLERLGSNANLRSQGKARRTSFWYLTSVILIQYSSDFARIFLDVSVCVMQFLAILGDL